MTSGTYRGLRLAVVVPTRNRWELASRAIASTLAQIAPGVSILVSDNSTLPDQSGGLERYCQRVAAPCVTYLRPPAPLSMTHHWDWAADQAVKLLQPTHVFYLTDRTIFKKGQLQRILDVVADHPEDVLSFRGEDHVADAEAPVRLVLHSCSDQLARLESVDLLAAAALMRFTVALPKMLNSVVPVQVVDAVRERFGSVFGSISPDVCFAFRCMAVVDSIRYLDSTPIIRTSLDRSNGYAWSTGRHSVDSLDFLRVEGGTISMAETPLPTLVTGHNCLVHEYCRAARETGSARFQAIDPEAYAEVIWRDLVQLAGRVELDRCRGLMEEAGLAVPSVDHFGTRARLGRICRSPMNTAARRFWRIAAGRHTQWLWPRLARVRLRPGTTERFQFPDAEEALRFAEGCPARVARRLSCPSSADGFHRTAKHNRGALSGLRSLRTTSSNGG